MRLTSLTSAIKITFVASLIATAVFGIAITVAPFAAPNFEYLAYTTMILALHAVVGLGLAVAMERSRARLWMRAGLLLDAGGLLVWWVYLWGYGFRTFGSGGMVGVSAACLSGWAALSMIAVVASRQPANTPAARVIRRATFILAIVLIPLLPAGAFAWESGSRVGLAESLARLFAALATLTIGGFTAGLVLARLGGLAEESAPQGAARRRLTVVCPRCLTRQILRTNGDTCARCGLRISVQIP